MSELMKESFCTVGGCVRVERVDTVVKNAGSGQDVEKETTYYVFDTKDQTTGAFVLSAGAWKNILDEVKAARARNDDEGAYDAATGFMVDHTKAGRPPIAEEIYYLEDELSNFIKGIALGAFDEIEDGKSVTYSPQPE